MCLCTSLRAYDYNAVKNNNGENVELLSVMCNGQMIKAHFTNIIQYTFSADPNSKLAYTCT